MVALDDEGNAVKDRKINFSFMFNEETNCRHKPKPCGVPLVLAKRKVYCRHTTRGTHSNPAR